MSTFWWIAFPLILAIVLYSTLSIGNFFALRRPGMAVMWFGYVLANCGLLYDYFTFGGAR